MAEILTPQQAQAVNDRGGTLLVSAAAGSGKTKVLVDRLLGYLTDPKDPANLDDFLIITYTRAAASELRGKIAAKLTERVAEEPENRHLQQQIQRLYLTKISTVHAFCADILREYAYRLDLPADFRIGEESECQELRERAMLQILEEAYESIGENGDFQAFIDTQGFGRNDKQIPEILLRVYDSARCHLNPEAWLDQCLINANVADMQDAAQTIWGRYLVEDLFSYLDKQIEAMTICADMALRMDGWENPSALLLDAVHQLQRLRASETWDEIIERKNISYGTLKFPKKGGDPELAERIKAVRNACKSGMDKKLKSFVSPSSQVLKDLEQSTAACRGMIELVKRFGMAFEKLKRGRRILDFGDLEHQALDLLLGKNRVSPTVAAAEIGKRFREIMVDEYQDSNAVQDAIFSALTNTRQNLFLVGDVKQSIYQFRLADPDIFLKKYAAFAAPEQARLQQGRKVLLSSNFRSSAGILSGVNDVFRFCMSPHIGGLYYGEEELLREGVPHIPLGEPEVELHVIDCMSDVNAKEAAYVSQRIRALLNGGHMVRQGDTLRPIIPDDIVILLRSPSSQADAYRQALELQGIRCVDGGSTDLLQTEEVGTLHALLQIISNPRQDIPLIAVLASPLFGFTADDLAAVRCHNRQISMYEALAQDTSRKSRDFLDTLNTLRKEARMNNLTQLMERIFCLTRIDSIYAAMPGGDAREKHLQAFYQLSVDFEASGRRDLSQFLDYLEAMSEKGIKIAEEKGGNGAVTIMSIHKSKGLEFPVVFLCGLSRGFNRDSAKAQVLCDRELGLGLSCADTVNRVRYPTLAKRAIKVKMEAESLSEEMRVLYVAMTRARDRLIMTYFSKSIRSPKTGASSESLKKTLLDIAWRMGIGSSELLTADVSCPGQWVLLAAMRRTEAGELFQMADRPDETKIGAFPWQIHADQDPEIRAVDRALAAEEKRLPKEALDRMRESLAFQYGHAAATAAPSKQTATQRKGRVKDQEAAENAQEPKQLARVWRKPSFAGAAPQPTAYGSAIHAVLQYIRYEACGSAAAVEKEVRRLVDERYITEEQGKLVNCGKIAKFFSTELGKRLQNDPSVLREFKFSILDDGAAYGPGLEGEQVLLQGVVDCALVEADGITVVDFKTDHVTEKTLPAVTERYRPQVEVYAEVLGRIYEKPVKGKLLYFFHLDQFVPL